MTNVDLPWLCFFTTSGALRDVYLGRAHGPPIPSFSPHLSPFPTTDSYIELLLHSLPPAVSAPYGQPCFSISPSPSLLCASKLSCIGTLLLCLTFCVTAMLSVRILLRECPRWGLSAVLVPSFYIYIYIYYYAPSSPHRADH